MATIWVTILVIIHNLHDVYITFVCHDSNSTLVNMYLSDGNPL